MKHLNKFAFIVLLLTGINVFAQSNQNLPLLGVTYFDVQGVELSQKEITSIVRMEIEKLKKYEVIDRYEIDNYYKTNNLSQTGCASKSCVLKAGQDLHLDYMVAGSVEKIGRMMAINIKLYDVKAGSQEASVVKEYIYQPLEMQTLLRFSVETLMGTPVKPELEALYLFQKHEDDVVEKPNVRRLNLSGPRFGVSFATGETSTILQTNTPGGFDMLPFMTQFGYHTEARYLNTGNVMAVIEFVGMVGGIDQGRFIPSLSFINGFRFKRSKWEFGFGPTFSVKQRARGFWHTDVSGGKSWHLESDLNAMPEHKGEKMISRLDSRGDAYIAPGWIMAIGRTFTSGNMNIPVNIYTIPNKQGWVVGISAGWSIEKTK